MINFTKKVLKGWSILLLITILFPLSLSAQNFNAPIKKIEQAKYIAVYSLNWQEDSTNHYFIRQEDMLLFLGEHVSKFVSRNYYNFDTIIRRIKNPAGFRQMLSNPSKHILISTVFLYQIFKNYPKGKITTIDHIIGGSFIYTENLELMDWKLSNDTTTISGYKVQKATCNFGGRSWIAWFAPEIPFRDGPYKFCGLPGLIIKIADTCNQYVFELESFNKSNSKTMIDYAGANFIKTTKQGFFKAKDDFRDSFISRAKEFGLNSREQQTGEKHIKVMNNPLELKRK